MKSSQKFLAALLVAATMLQPQRSTAAPIEVPVNANYTITPDTSAIPQPCPDEHHQWFRNGVFTGVTTPTYTIAPGTLVEGENVSFSRITLCEACPPHYRLPDVQIHAFNPVTLSFSCDQTQEKGIFKMGVPADTCYVQFTVECSHNNVPLNITTQPSNGITLRCDTTLMQGTNHVKLYASGTPVNAGHTHFTLDAGSNIYGAALCTIDVFVSIAKFHIELFSTLDDRWNLGNPDAAMPRMSNNRCGIPGASMLCSVDTFEFQNNTSAIDKNTNFSGFDLVVVGYNKTITSNNVAALRTLVTVQRIPLVLCEEGAAGVGDLVDFANSISLNSVSDEIDADPQEASYPFVAGAPVVSGPYYQDLTGKMLGADGGANRDFTGVDTSVWYVIAGTKDAARAIMHKTYPLILMGDAGVLSGGYGTANRYDDFPDFHPAKVDANGVPIAKTNTKRYTVPVYNSHFALNIMEWAIDLKSRR